MTGPFVDNMGIDMLQGGGKLFAGSSGRYIGPGHFGLLDLGDGVQKFSCHYEADLDRGGISVLDIRPLLWRDGWPVAGDNLTAGTYEIESARRARRSRWRCRACRSAARAGAADRGPAGTGASGPAASPRRPGRRSQRRMPRKSAATGRPAGRRSHGALHAAGAAEVDDHARREAGGYPGSPYFKITIAGTDRALAATADGELGRCRVHRRARTALAHRPARRRHLPDDAEGDSEFDGIARAVGDRQQHANAREVQSGKRSAAMASEGPVISRESACEWLTSARSARVRRR